MSAVKIKSTLYNQLVILLIFLIEALIFIFLSAYKYQINYSTHSIFSLEFLKIFFSNYNLFYTGNLIILFLLLLAMAACIKLMFDIHKVKNSSLKLILALEVSSVVILIFSLIASKEAFDEVTGKFLQLDARGSKIVSLSIFIGLKIFCVTALSVVAYSTLKKLHLIKVIWVSLIMTLLAIFIVFISVHLYTDDAVDISRMGQIDSGVILGAAVWGGNKPSPILRERINKGYELFSGGKIGSIVLTGGGYKGDKTEADVAKEELMKKGIEEKYIITENQSYSTLQQINYISKNIYRARKWNNLILISDNFHLFRSKQICKFFGMKCYTVASDTPLSAESGISFSLKEAFAVIIFWLFGIG